LQVLEKAFELGKFIAETEEYKQMKNAEEFVRKDEIAMKKLREFQMMRQSYQRMQMSGQQLTQEHIQKLRDSEKKMLENRAIKSYYEARERFQSLVQKVNGQIQEGMGEQPAGTCDTNTCGTDCST